jgi:hypothetical protein
MMNSLLPYCDALENGSVLYLTESQAGTSRHSGPGLSFRPSTARADGSVTTSWNREAVRRRDLQAFQLDASLPVRTYVMQRRVYVSKDVVRTAYIVFPTSRRPPRCRPSSRLAKLAPLLSSSFDDLINPADEVLDAHTTKNNWQMYEQKAGARSLPRQPPPDCRLWVR